MISKLLYDIFIGTPTALVKDILEKLTDEINKKSLLTEDSIKERLQELQLLLEDGDISEEEYEELETKLIERLKAVREYNKNSGGK
jgi:hypothetical protein